MRLPEALFAPAFAHRGLWRPDGPPENSLAAIAAALDQGYGVEFDVRLSADGEPVVFHDETLERLTGVAGRVDDFGLAALQALRLPGGEAIPTLAEVLSLAAGRGMLLVELKDPGHTGVLEPKVAALLDAYAGDFAVISFQAQSLAWFADHRPEVPRGLDATGASDQQLMDSSLDLEHIFEGQFDLARPHFLVLDKAMAGGRIARRYRSRGLPVVAWTVRAAAEVGPLSGHIDNIIFEGFTA